MQMNMEDAIAAFKGRSFDDDCDVLDALKLSGIDRLEFLEKKYHQSKTWQERSRCIYFCIGRTRTDKRAISLCVTALNDRSKEVVYRACQGLAYSLAKEVIPDIERAVATFSDRAKRMDGKRAILAIRHQDHNLFVDPTGSGRTTFNAMTLEDDS